MTMIELTFAIFHACALVVAGWLGFERLGVVGAIVGALAAALGLWLFYKTIRLLEIVWRKRYPLRPTCRNGICPASNYKRLEVRRDCLVYQCGCGTTYVYKGTQFLELLPDGTLKRFMRKRAGLGGWEPDAG